MQCKFECKLKHLLDSVYKCDIQRYGCNITAGRALREHAYSNILKISPPKTESFQIKIDIFHISAQNIDCAYSLEPPSTHNLCF